MKSKPSRIDMTLFFASGLAFTVLFPCSLTFLYMGDTGLGIWGVIVSIISFWVFCRKGERLEKRP